MNSTVKPIFISQKEALDFAKRVRVNEESKMRTVNSDEQALTIPVAILIVTAGIAIAILLACFLKNCKFCILVRTLGRSLIYGYHKLINWMFPCCDSTETTIILTKSDFDSDYNPVPSREIHVQTSACPSTDSVMEMQHFHANGESVEGFLHLPPPPYHEVAAVHVPVQLLRAHSFYL